MFDFFIKIAEAQVRFPSIGGSDQNIPGLISEIYSFAFAIVGIAIFIQLLIAGFKWMTAAASPGNISDAREKIKNAIIGAIFLFSSWLILNVINPDLVKNTFNFFGILGTDKSTKISPPEPSESLALQATQKPAVEGTPGEISGYYNNQPSGNFLGKGANAQSGLSHFVIRVTDFDGSFVEKLYTIFVSGARAMNSDQNREGNWTFDFGKAGVASAVTMTITPSDSNLKDGVVGFPYYQELDVVGGTGPFIWEIIDGGLPAGLELREATEARADYEEDLAKYIERYGEPPPVVIDTITPIPPSPTRTPSPPRETEEPPPVACANICKTRVSSCTGSFPLKYQKGEIHSCYIGGVNECFFDSECSPQQCNMSTSGDRCGCGEAYLDCCQAVNPVFWATESTAEKLADCLGGDAEVVQTFLDWPYQWTTSDKEEDGWYDLSFCNGINLNAGLVANNYNTRPKEIIDQQIVDQLCD